MVYEALPSPEIDAESKRSPGSIGGYHEDSEDATAVLRYRLGYCQVSHDCDVPNEVGADNVGSVL